MEDYPTHYLGKTSRGIRFWAYETFVFTKPYHEIKQGEDWRVYRKEYVLLHKFNRWGRHLGTDYWFAGTTAECDNDQMAKKIGDMIDALGKVKYCDIKISLFQAVIDGVVFGLVVDSNSTSIVLQPSSTISFQPPWDGEYYT